MAKVHKVTMFVKDIDGDSNLEDLIKYGLNRYDMYPKFIEVKSSEEFEWDDDLEINMSDCEKEAYEKYFE